MGHPDETGDSVIDLCQNWVATTMTVAMERRASMLAISLWLLGSARRQGRW